MRRSRTSIGAPWPWVTTTSILAPAPDDVRGADDGAGDPADVPHERVDASAPPAWTAAIPSTPTNVHPTAPPSRRAIATRCWPTSCNPRRSGSPVSGSRTARQAVAATWPPSASSRPSRVSASLAPSAVASSSATAGNGREDGGQLSGPVSAAAPSRAAAERPGEPAPVEQDGAAARDDEHEVRRALQPAGRRATRGRRAPPARGTQSACSRVAVLRWRRRQHERGDAAAGPRVPEASARKLPTRLRPTRGGPATGRYEAPRTAGRAARAAPSPGRTRPSRVRQGRCPGGVEWLRQPAGGRAGRRAAGQRDAEPAARGGEKAPVGGGVDGRTGRSRGRGSGAAAGAFGGCTVRDGPLPGSRGAGPA